MEDHERRRHLDRLPTLTNNPPGCLLASLDNRAGRVWRTKRPADDRTLRVLALTKLDGSAGAPEPAIRRRSGRLRLALHAIQGDLGRRPLRPENDVEHLSDMWRRAGGTEGA